MYRQFYGPGLGGGGLLLGLLSVIFWVAVIWLVVSLLINHGHLHRHETASAVEDPLAIAKARYARGEIDQTEFNRIKKDLQS